MSANTTSTFPNLAEGITDQVTKCHKPPGFATFARFVAMTQSEHMSSEGFYSC
jgi:hypothetical protein